jgi:hypothetical protein
MTQCGARSRAGSALRGVVLTACALTSIAEHTSASAARGTCFATSTISPLGGLTRSLSAPVCVARRRIGTALSMCALPAETVVDRADGWIRRQTFGELFKKQEVKDLLQVATPRRFGCAQSYDSFHERRS